MSSRVSLPYTVGSRIEMAEVDAGDEAFIQLADLHNLLERAELVDLAHGFRAGADVGKALRIQRLERALHRIEREGERLFPRHFTQRPGMHHDAGAPHGVYRAGALEDIIDAVVSLFLFRGREGDIIGRVEGEGDAVLPGLFTEPTGLVFPDMNAAAALVFKGVEAERFEVARHLEGGFIAELRKPCAASGGAESNHNITLRFSGGGRGRAAARPPGRAAGTVLFFTAAAVFINHARFKMTAHPEGPPGFRADWVHEDGAQPGKVAAEDIGKNLVAHDRRLPPGEVKAPRCAQVAEAKRLCRAGNKGEPEPPGKGGNARGAVVRKNGEGDAAGLHLGDPALEAGQGRLVLIHGEGVVHIENEPPHMELLEQLRGDIGHAVKENIGL